MTTASDAVAAGFEAFTVARGWTRADTGHAVRFERDDGRVMVEGDCDVAPDGRFRRPPSFLVVHRLNNRIRTWHITTDANGSQEQYRQTADMVGMLDGQGMLLGLQIIDSVDGTTVTDSDHQPGPWHHDLVDPTWDEALDWVVRYATIAAPASHTELSGVERRLGVRLPPRYRQFLARTGGALLWATNFHATHRDEKRRFTTVLDATEAARRRGLFHDAVVIAANPIGGDDVLDLRQGDDPPVLNFDPDRFGLLAPDNIEDDEEELDGTVEEAADFAEYFCDAVELSAKHRHIDRWNQHR